MEAHEIVDRTMARGDAEKLARLTGRKADLYNSYRRAPRCPENPFGTGNYSPVHYYLGYVELFKAINPSGAVQLHHLVTAEVMDGISEQAGDASFRELSRDVLTRATEAVNQMNEKEINAAGLDELKALDEKLGRLQSAVEITRALVRTKLRQRQASYAEAY